MNVYHIVLEVCSSYYLMLRSLQSGVKLSNKQANKRHESLVFSQNFDKSKICLQTRPHPHKPNHTSFNHHHRSFIWFWPKTFLGVYIDTCRCTIAHPSSSLSCNIRSWMFLCVCCMLSSLLSTWLCLCLILHITILIIQLTNEKTIHCAWPTCQYELQSHFSLA